MLIVMKPSATPEQIEAVAAYIRGLKLKAHVMPGAGRTAIGVTGNAGPLDPTPIAAYPGVAQTISVTKPYKLVSRALHPERTAVVIGDPSRGRTVEIGGSAFALIAGPCSVESREQILSIARHVAACGAHALRGGAFKPRTSPYSFQGLGEEGLELLAAARAETGLPIVTEAVDFAGVDLVERYADMIQIGARNMQNYSLLRRVGQSPLPVLLKRGMAATVDELLQAAEYVMSEGNYRVVLCERGIRTFTDHTRNTLDLAAVLTVQEVSHLPILVDPSHGSGKRLMVGPLSRAAAAVGADGILVEVHNDPDRALSDGAQSLTFKMFQDLLRQVPQIARMAREGGEA